MSSGSDIESLVLTQSTQFEFTDDEDDPAHDDSSISLDEWEDFPEAATAVMPPMEVENVADDSFVVEAKGSFSYEVDGTKIYFPYKPYPSQEQMMDALVKVARDETHALLESPTGTGKTAALLCGLLGWLEDHEDQIDMCNSIANCSGEWSDSSNDGTITKQTKSAETSFGSIFESSISKDDSVGEAKKQKLGESYQPQEPPKIRIIYATRTHSQIRQVVNQLKQTKYAKTPMTVLGSRKQACINPIAKDPIARGAQGGEPLTVDEMCARLRIPAKENEEEEQKKSSQSEKKLPPCKYYTKDDPTFTTNFMRERNSLAFDIEDIMKAGEKHVSCPYYALKKLQEEAKLIICTYNHVLHRYIRKNCKLELEGSIIVFDEAHNIEDVCRDLASMKVSGMKIAEIKMALNGLKNVPDSKGDAPILLTLAISKLWKWLADEESSEATGYKFDPDEGDDKGKVYSKNVSEEFINQLESLGWAPMDIPKLWRAYFRMMEEESGGDDRPPYYPPKKALDAYSSVLMVFQYLYKSRIKTQDGKHRCADYEILITKRIANSKQRRSAMSFKTAPDVKFENIELAVLCLNPGITFNELKEARSIIVTSGTLSPIASFASELDVDFAFQLTLPHVLGSDRVFPAIISKYSNSSQPLNFSASSLKFRFEELARDLGDLIKRVCEIVPKGVLVFFPSKTLLIRMKQFWTNNKMLEAFEELKHVFTESDAQTASEFNDLMSEYKAKALEGKGALLFSVLRGKVSEGVDFKDDEARAVITVGIPFQPFKDQQVKAKQDFNDRMNLEMPEKQYLPGFEWYSGNAFRALNQAVGRCIRHSKDWGLIFIVDSRFASKVKYQASLPKWIQAAYNSRYGTTLESVFPHAKKFISHTVKLGN